MKHYGTDGKEWDRPNHIPPVTLLEEDTTDYVKGWYHSDEVEQLMGPFNTFEEASLAYKEYCKNL